MNRAEELKNAIITALDPKTPSKVSDEVLSVVGFSGIKYKHFSNRLLSNPCIRNYLEIGVWKGSTAIAALYGNHKKINYTVIDNFSLFGGQREEFTENWKKYMIDDPNLIDDDCFKIDPKEKGIANIDVYFYDGEHKENDQYEALHHYISAMSNPFIFMVDDWSWADVQNGTNRAIKELNLKVLFKQEFFGSNDSSGWWNGCGIFVLER
jgi:hypothetical protein